MHIGQMAHAVLLAAMAFVAAALLRADVPPPGRRPLVLYLGHGRTEADVGYQRFALALAQARRERFGELRLGYASIPDHLDDSLPALARAMTQHPALIVAPTAGSMRAATRLAGATPVVFASYMDPIRSGFVDSLRARTRPVTGVDLTDQLDGKRLEILHEAYPGVRNVAVIADPEWASDTAAVQRVQSESRTLGIRVTVLFADSREELADLFARPATRQYDGWYVPPTYLEERARDLIAQTMRAWGKPCIYSETLDVRSGGLMSYTQDAGFAWSALADLVGRVLDGEPAGAIPIERPQRFELAVRVSPGLGVAPPADSVLARADVIVR